MIQNLKMIVFTSLNRALTFVWIYKKKETVFGFRTRKLEVLLFWRES